jgi:hypothetical protein
MFSTSTIFNSIQVSVKIVIAIFTASTYKLVLQNN